MSLKQLSVEDITGRKFLSSTVSGVQWLLDGSGFTFTKTSGLGGQDIYRHNVETNEDTLILDGSKLSIDGKPVEMSGYQTTGQQNILLITGTQKQIWRYSFAAPYYLYYVDTKTLVPLANGDSDLQNVELSSDNNRVAYVKGSNLYVASSKGGEVKQLTHDGSDDILNGIFDWVYEEEFQRPDAFRWSPDGKHIAFWRTDQSRVKSFTLFDDVSSKYPKVTPLKYPKVGEQNSVVKILVVNVDTGKITEMDIGTNDDIYIPRIDWTTSPTTLCIQRLNRRQNELELLFADITTGTTRVVLTDKTTTGWIDITDDFIFFKSKDEFIWSSEKSGYRHIYHTDYSGKEIGQITSGDWEVTSVIGFDESKGNVYFYGKRHGLENQVVYRVNINDKTIVPVSDLAGWTKANFSPTFNHYIATHSTASIPDKVYLRNSDGSLVSVLEKNNIAAMNEYILNWPTFTKITVDDGNGGKVDLNSYLVKPSHFDPSKKYPVLVFGYSGPATQVVANQWVKSRALFHSMIAELGCLVFCVDHRGTGGCGRDFKHHAYGDLSKYIVLDQIEGVKYLRSLPFVDPSRVGVWGWSGGGYLTLMLLTRAADYFSCGVAVAPVSDFSTYDTIWTERYMDLLKTNPKGYKDADVLTYLDKLKGKLLIIHGSGDDNVHVQNTMLVVDKLISINKQFEMMIYPNKNHGIYGGLTQTHLFTLITNFFKSNLGIN
eukprot:TRINITY_DN4818_c0_g1_i1.p1 TRINITY_DN4818_c0_g1~~TRINITY_DN4818_c0_g1_i1.p1  ORF type:complete len:714 (-),score=148.89 TRINITY_DN4818_c0_g1_i1:61-2202(-)